MSEPRTCRGCGCPSDPGTRGALTWMCDRLPDGGRSWLCGDCTRSRLRGIESRLPDDWL